MNYVNGKVKNKKVKDVLTPRQLEVFWMSMYGYPNITIAKKLKVSVFTVKWHKTQMFKAFKVKGTKDLMKNWKKR